MTEAKTMTWWRILSGMALANLLVWLGSFFVLCPEGWSSTPSLTRQHLILSGIYSTVCAFRSCFPRIDLERYVLFDHFASSIVLGRSAATVAEIAFAYQMKLVVDELCIMAGLSSITHWTCLIVISLSMAQVFCWISVLNLSHFGHMVEESLWGLTFAMIGFLIYLCLPHLNGTWVSIAWVGMIAVLSYVVFMMCIDVPMYYRRWRAGQIHGDRPQSLRAGWHDALYRRVTTRDWNIWRPEVMWLSGYFTGAVWFSLSLAYLPR